MPKQASPTPPPIRLGINIDHVATLRQARGTMYPDVIAAARCAMDAGADSITVHLREDRRHIQDNDVMALVALGDTPINLELAVTDEMLSIAEYLEPSHACFVPERREELTTEGGLDVASQVDRVKTAIMRLRIAGVRPALFIDPDPVQIEAAAATGARQIELHTGRFADAADAASRAVELKRLTEAATQARGLKLEVHAGHGLNVDNVAAIAAMPQVVELNIGHAIVARAVFTGLAAAVTEMRDAMNVARNREVTA